MTQLTYDNLSLNLLMFVTISVYIIIIVIFLNARKKYQGGIVGQVINMIIATIGFILVADIAIFLIPIYGFNLSYPIHVVLKIIAMTCLAIGGLKFFVR